MILDLEASAARRPVSPRLGWMLSIASAAVAAAALLAIAAHVAHVTSAVERLFAKGSLDPDRVIGDTPLRRAGAPRFEMAAWAPAAQFVYHGIDHRSQIDTILSTHGLETLDLQVWPYAMELGASREAKEDR